MSVLGAQQLYSSIKQVVLLIVLTVAVLVFGGFKGTPSALGNVKSSKVTAVWSNPQHLDLFITGKDGRVMSTW